MRKAGVVIVLAVLHSLARHAVERMTLARTLAASGCPMHGLLP